jgi:outer membrane protein TolC
VAAPRAAAAAPAADRRPRIALQAGYRRTQNVDEFVLPDLTTGEPVLLFADVPDNLRARLDLEWPIYTGGRTDALARAARATAAATNQERAAALADLKLEITRAYWAVVTSAAAVGVLEQSVARFDEVLTYARAREQAGLVPPTDVLASEAQRSRQQMLLIEARNQVEATRADFRRLIGLPPDAPFDLEAALTPPAASDVPAPTLVEEARGQRADRKRLEAQRLSAEETGLAASAGLRPSVILSGGYDYLRPNPAFFPRLAEWRSSWDIGVSLSWSLWDGGRTRAQMAEADANRRAAEALLRDFDQELEAEVRRERLALASALAAVSSADDGLRSATEARRVMAERYAAGIATNAEALDAQLALVQAELDRTRAVANARLASARLDRVLGR